MLTQVPSGQSASAVQSLPFIGSTIANLDGGGVELLLNVNDDLQDLLEDLRILNLLGSLGDFIGNFSHDLASDNGRGFCIRLKQRLKVGGGVERWRARAEGRG